MDGAWVYAVATTVNGARAIWRVSKNGGEPRAISVDDTTVFVAPGERDDGAIHAIARR